MHTTSWQLAASLRQVVGDQLGVLRFAPSVCVRQTKSADRRPHQTESNPSGGCRGCDCPIHGASGVGRTST